MKSFSINKTVIKVTEANIKSDGEEGGFVGGVDCISPIKWNVIGNGATVPI